LKGLDCEEAMVVHGLDGLDEISTIGKTRISWLKNRKVSTKEISPKDFGIEKARIEDIKGNSPEESARITFEILYGSIGALDPRREIVQVNGAAAIIIAGKADDFEGALEVAKESIDSGNAYHKLKELIRFSGGKLTKLEQLETKNA
jgi:anthranilate phosphoribosyltransferase